MRKSISTSGLSGTLREKLEAIAAARFDGYELFENDLIYFNGSPATVGRIAADLGLSCELYQPFRDFEGAPDALVRKNFDRAERKFDVMQAMGASLMLVCSNTSAQLVPDEERMAAQLYELAERAARRNLRIGFEALGWGRVVKLYAQAWSIVQRGNHPHLGLILDSFHTFSLHDDPSGIAKIPGEKIFFMQLADAPLMAMDVLQWARHYRNFPGQGQFDLENFLEQVLIAGYAGPISLEIFNDLFREVPNRPTALDAMRSLLYLEGQVRNRLESAAKKNGEAANVKARVLERIELFDPPNAPPLSGVSFLEFAVDETSGRVLAALLESFGFRYAGKHRSKEVTLYRQGNINLVLNADPLSFAHTHFLEHGATVCAIGLQTDDPMRALNRATALHCARFDSPIGPNELQVAAIRTPAAGLIYFVPAQLGPNGLFETDFVLAGGATDSGTGAGLKTVDHIAFGLPLDQLDTWILFCRAVLTMQPGDSLELSDPFGLVRGAGVATRDRTVRFVFNASASQRTGTARAVAAIGGGGVHHIALSCEDIFESVAKLRAKGVEFVPISPNYYDDLLARLDVEPSYVERLRGLGILYDRSVSGEFFHIYTPSFAGRFFFEIMQRTGSYDTYGASNAPARMASQAQHAAVA